MKNDLWYVGDWGLLPWAMCICTYVYLCVCVSVRMCICAYVYLYICVWTLHLP